MRLGPRIAVVLLTAGIFAVGGCGKTSGNNAGPGAGAPPAMPVQVQVVKTQKIPETTEYLSILKSRHSATINPQVEGQITKIFVKSGDHVKEGTPLLQIDPNKQEATVGSQEAARRAQEASTRYAKVQLERERKLLEAGVVSKQEFDNAQSAYDSAEAQLKSLEEQVNQQKVELRYYQVTSPMSGIVGDVPVRMGDRVGVTTLLTTVDEPGALEAYIYVPADKAKDLKVGLPVHLLDVAGNPVNDTRISFISPQVDTDTQTVLAKAQIENGQSRLRVAQQVRAQVTWNVHEGTVVPVLAVSRINGQFFAFVASKEGNGTVARQRLLQVGDTVGNDFVVQSGLKPGDHLILSGTQFLQDGAPVSEQIGGGSGAAANGATR
ncbi:MAG TPA: efflux RND transporter periplasmic adaptor subunit [Candidatus Acidoferrum sp.]